MKTVYSIVEKYTIEKWSDVEVDVSEVMMQQKSIDFDGRICILAYFL